MARSDQAQRTSPRVARGYVFRTEREHHGWKESGVTWGPGEGEGTRKTYEEEPRLRGRTEVGREDPRQTKMKRSHEEGG